jgi:hypothetical protein
MSALTRQPEYPFNGGDWQPDTTQLLDEHHMVAWSNMPRRRVHFATSLAQFLETQRDTEVCVFYGRFITDLESFCYQLERAVPGQELERRLDGPRGVIALLRHRQSFRGRAAAKFRYYVWHDADVLLRHNHLLFGLLVDALAGVAAEAEYASDDLLLLHRSVFVGGPMLDLYAEDPRGQFQSWQAEEGGEPFWQIVSGIERPPFRRFHIDQLGGGYAGQTTGEPALIEVPRRPRIEARRDAR